jgi:GNAT superfamily N-acetyltransferase
MKLLRTTSENEDFRRLVQELDAYLATTDGEEHAFYHQFNGIGALQHCIVAYDGDFAVGCGAIKSFDASAMEVKRMFVPPGLRGNGIASGVLAALESWAAELGYRKCILETGKRQSEAVALYKKNGYRVTENYGQYAGVENSVCFEKPL